MTPTLRAEGITEAAGDILIRCTGANSLSAGTTASFALTFNTTITSRVLTQLGPSGSQTDALMLVDEPQPGSQNYGTGPTANVLPGNVYASDQKTVFFSLPQLPAEPTTTLRFTDLRVNASALTPGSNITAAVTGFTASKTGTAPITITPPTVVLGKVQPGLSLTTPVEVIAFLQCQGQNTTPTSGLTLNAEVNFSAVLKPRIDPNVNPSPDANTAAAPTPQNVPGTVYSGESGFIPSLTSSAPPGLANFGTRLKATITNVPPGVTVYAPVVATSGPRAELRSADVGSDGAAPFSPATPSASVTGQALGDPSLLTQYTGAVQVPAGGITYEFLATGPLSTTSPVYNIKIPFAISYPANSTAPSSTSQILINYAPASTVTGASATAPIPRFVPPPSRPNVAAQLLFLSCNGAPPFTTVNDAGFSPLGGVAPGSIAAGFAQGGLATGTASATSTPLPLILAGRQVVIEDSRHATAPAPLFYVSPTQINYQVPAGLATGPGIARVVDSSNNVVAIGSINIEPLAPALFDANGIAAGQAVTGKADGTQTTQNLASLDSSGKLVPTVINVSDPTSQVFLVLYGTGFRGDTNLADYKLTIGSTNVPVVYAAADPDYVGVDQLNAGPLSPSLAGAGTVTVALTVGGNSSPSVVTVQIQ